MNALYIIQQKLKAPKNQENKFGKYKYRNAEDILEALKPLLGETESTLILDDCLECVGNMVFIAANATLTDKDGKQYTATAYARHSEELKGMQDSQVSGATSSYARKYALNGLFLIDDTKDADATNDGTKIAAKKAPTPPKAAPTNVPKAEAKELPWLNPDTPNWVYAKKRITEGVTLETIKKSFRISESNAKLLTTNETAPLA